MTRYMPTLLMTLLIALQSVVASADVHLLFDETTEHNAAALEHRHGDGQPLHGHQENDDHDSSPLHSHAFETQSDADNMQSGGEGCQHCCHCHSPGFSSMVDKGLALNLSQIRSLLASGQQYWPSQPYSPALRPPKHPA